VGSPTYKPWEAVVIKNFEIEFKSAITEEKYHELLQAFALENNIFKQTNYYFDTDDYYFKGLHTVIRIRQKGESRFKVTMKAQGELGSFENHVFLKKEDALKMLEEGFNTADFFEHEDHQFVTYKVSLDNYRASTPYEGGTLFLDRSQYCGVIDYEIEYEANDYDEGKKIFEQFMVNHHLKTMPTKRKSERAFSCQR